MRTTAITATILFALTLPAQAKHSSTAYDPRPGAWCGWYARHHLVGRDPGRRFNLAREWARYGSRSPRPVVGVIVAWFHHVGKIVGPRDRHGRWLVKSGNDSGRVRTRYRSVAGAIAFRLEPGPRILLALPLPRSRPSGAPQLSVASFEMPRPRPPIRPTVPEPIATSEDRENIFRRYEVSQLRPIGNCQDFEHVDPRVKLVVAAAAEHFGGVALASSCYRSVAYNRKVGGAHRSQHIAHKALDFVVRVKDQLVDKFKLARFVRAEPIMQKIGGVGTYCKSAAIHADVGPKRDWHYGCGPNRYAGHKGRVASLSPFARSI